MKNKILDFTKRNTQLLIPIGLLVISVSAYGVLIPFLGLYWDGWPYMYQYHVFGPGGFPSFVAQDRPFSGLFFVIISAILGTNVWGYHIFALFSHWLAALGVWLLLNEIWTEQKTLNSIPAFLFAIYPGFMQQPIAYPYSHHLSHLAMFMFSLIFMLRAIKTQSGYIFYTALSLLLSLNMFSLEYFATLEFIRPILLFLVIRNDLLLRKDLLIKRLLRYWVPFLIVLIYFLVWRIFIFKFPTYEPSLVAEIATNSSSNLSELLKRIAHDFYVTNIQAWINIFSIPKYEEVWAKGIIGFWTVFSFTLLFMMVAFYLLMQKASENPSMHESSNKKWAIEISILGIICFLLSGWVAWITQLPVILEFAWDRLTLTFMFGACLLLSGVIVYIFGSKVYLRICLSLLIALACGFHFLNALGFVRDWESFKDFVWQLSWRIPSLEPGTTILTTRFPLKYYSDNSLTAPINWMFTQQKDNADLKYLVSFIDVRLGWRIKALEPGHKIDQPYRSFFFEGSTSQVIAIKYNPPGCVQIMDSIYANAGILPNLNENQAGASTLTDLSLIRLSKTSATPPTEIVGEEPDHDWCYYFEKADLARQFGNWDEIIELGEKAQSAGKVARVPTEWLPFLEAYLRRGLSMQVNDVIDRINKDNPGKYKNSICYTLNRIYKEDSLNRDLINLVMNENNCNQ